MAGVLNRQLESPPHRNIGNRKACQFLGRKFASKKERNEFYGLKYETQDVIEKRLARGWTKRQAAELDPAPPRPEIRTGLNAACLKIVGRD